MSRTTSIWLLLGLPLLLSRCKDAYVSPYKSPKTGYLVVEGYISGNTTSQFTLSRTLPLPDDSTLPSENGAIVQIRGSDNSSYPLTEMGSGIYKTVDTLVLNPELTYAMSIKTSNGEQYLSDYVPFRLTPAIDSVNWVENGDNSINIYANTHDPANNTHYYQWNFDQAYEYHSAEPSSDIFDPDTIPPFKARTPAQEIYRCWKSGGATDVIIDNTTKLTADVVYEQLLKYIPPNDIQTSVLYTILVRQYALTIHGYNFLTQMQQNTESLGGIFDLQPSQITGNIHCITHPAEQVIGYVSAGTVRSQRIWIYRDQIRNTYSCGCPIPDTLFNNGLSQWINVFGGGGQYTPLYFSYPPNDYKDKGELGNFTGCLDCTLAGGTNVEPNYWPN